MQKKRNISDTIKKQDLNEYLIRLLKKKKNQTDVIIFF